MRSKNASRQAIVCASRRASRRCALASFFGRFGYRRRAHGEFGRASRIAPTIARIGTNMPNTPVQILPLSRQNSDRDDVDEDEDGDGDAQRRRR